MSDHLRAILNTIARDTLGRDADLPEGELSEHLDSMDRLALVVAIEDHFQIIFEAEDDEAIRTVDDVIALVRAKLGTARA